MTSFAKSFEFDPTLGVQNIDGQPFPWYIAEDGPRIEPSNDGATTTLWLPVLIDQPCPQLGAPEVTACKFHRLIQHRDGQPPWCHACGLDADGILRKTIKGGNDCE